jgi:hypothetical protein
MIPRRDVNHRTIIIAPLTTTAVGVVVGVAHGEVIAEVEVEVIAAEVVVVEEEVIAAEAGSLSG